MGCPIRKSADQSFFAAPHGLSQRSTSFIASQRQGIHRTPLRHLIALIINAHPLGVGTLIRKTSLLRTVPTACGQAADNNSNRASGLAIPVLRLSSRGFVHDRSSELAHGRDFHHAPCSERSYLFTMSDIFRYRPRHVFAPDRDRAPPSSLAARCKRAIVISRTSKVRSPDHSISRPNPRSQLVEPDGIEPTTSCLQSRRSPN